MGSLFIAISNFVSMVSVAGASVLGVATVSEASSGTWIDLRFRGGDC